jgi:hypothetical protein
MRRDEIEELFYGKPEQQRRFTQDFPILPDVWIAYGKAPTARVELLLTPHTESDAPGLARALRHRLALDTKSVDTNGVDPGSADDRSRHPAGEPQGQGRAQVLFNESVVLAKLSFRELLCDAMPLTDWWKRVVTPIGGVWVDDNLRSFAASLGQPPGRDGVGNRRATGSDPRLPPEAHQDCRPD